LVAAAAAAVLVGACGGAMPAAAPTSAPAQHEENAPAGGEVYRPSTTSTAPGTETPTSAPTFAQPPRGQTWSSLVQAEQALDASGSDCATACRALGSMDRATGQLCVTASDDSEHGQCDDAKARLLRARDRVRTSCGGCPGGPSVDRDAPIPSTPTAP
jgi:hypothetical protein